MEDQWTSQRVPPRAGCGRGARLIQEEYPRYVVSVSTTGLQAVGAAAPGSADWAIAEGGGLAALSRSGGAKPCRLGRRFLH